MAMIATKMRNHQSTATTRQSGAVRNITIVTTQQQLVDCEEIQRERAAGPEEALVSFLLSYQCLNYP